MKKLFDSHVYEDSIDVAKNMTGSYDTSVTFHCWWDGELNDKHLYSIKSFYLFNVVNKPHKIVLWTTSITNESYLEEIKKFATIRIFNLEEEKIGTPFENITYVRKEYTECVNLKKSLFSDYVRYLLLCKYGGCWFDLDCFCLRSLDPLFNKYSNEICVYQWSYTNTPNAAIYISLEQNKEKMKKNIEFIIKRNNGWGFREAGLTYDLDLDMLVLPCGWFDPFFSKMLEHQGDDIFTNIEGNITLEEYFPGSFCHHWHNRWYKPIDESSIFRKLCNDVDKRLQ